MDNPFSLWGQNRIVLKHNGEKLHLSHIFLVIYLLLKIQYFIFFNMCLIFYSLLSYLIANHNIS